MNEILELIAKELANKNQVVKFKHGSVFNLLETTGATSDSIALISSKLANSIRNDVDKFRNVYLQEAKAYGEAVRKELSTFNENEDLSKYKVIEQYIPSILDYYGEKNILAPKRQVRELPIASISINVPEDNEIMEYLKVSNPIEQKYIDAVVAEYGNAEEIEKLWNMYLANVSQGNPNIENLPYGPSEKIYEIILLDVIVKKLKDDKPAGVNTPDTAYRNTMNEFHSELLNLMSIFVNDYNNSVKLDKVVTKRLSPTEVLVNRTVYEKLLDDITSDVMLGYIVSGSELKFLSDIKVNADQFVKAWSDKVKLNKIAGATNKVKRYKAAYANVVGDIYSNIDKLKLHDDVLQALMNVKDSDVLNVDKTTSYILGTVIYPDSNYLKFISAMEEYMTLDNKLTNVEAASLAAIDIIIDYLLQQVEIEGI